MKMETLNKRKNRVIDAFYSMYPVHFIVTPLALNCIFRRNGHLESSFSLIKSIALILCFGLIISIDFFVKATNSIFKSINVSVKLTDSLKICFDYCQYIVDLYFVKKLGTDVCLEYFKLYDFIDNIIGMRYYNRIRTKIIKSIGFLAITCFISSTCDFIVVVRSYDWFPASVYSLDYFYFALKTLNTLQFVGHVLQIEYRLRMIGDLLQDYSSSANTLPGLVDIMNNKNWIHSSGKKGKSRLNDLKILTYDRYNEILWLSRCYMLLLEQASYINRMYGFRVLLNCLSILMDMITLMNMAARVIMGSMYMVYNQGYLPVLTSAMRLSTCAIVLINMIHRCEKSYRQTERVVCIIDHLLVNKKTNIEVRKALKELRSFVVSRPVNFHAANFFRLEYPLLVSTASVVVTYTIILLQSLK